MTKSPGRIQGWRAPSPFTADPPLLLVSSGPVWGIGLAWPQGGPLVPTCLQGGLWEPPSLGQSRHPEAASVSLNWMQEKVTETSGKSSHLAGSHFFHLGCGMLTCNIPSDPQFWSAPLSPPACRAAIVVPVWHPYSQHWKK